MSLREGRRTFLASLAVLALPGLARATPRAQSAQLARVAIGVAPAEAEETRALLAEALREELGRNTAIELVDEARAAFVLNATVRREPTGCVVSVLVEERRSRRLRAILEGSARAPQASEDVETSALVRVAVRSALRSLGRAIA